MLFDGPVVWLFRILFSKRLPKLESELSIIKKISILGMKESGKTQFLSTLQGKTYSTYLQSSYKEYKNFNLTLTSGKTVEIASGMDIGGSDSFVQQYTKISEGADAVFFVFDCYRFKHDDNTDYRTQTRARLQFIGDELGISKRIIIIGSHADQFKDDASKNDGKEFAIKNLQEFYQPFLENFFMIDTRDHDQVIEICDKLWSKINPVRFIESILK